MTLKTICQDAAGEIGFPVPTTIVSNTEETAQQLFRLAKKEGDLLSRKKKWQALVKETSITLALADQDYALATDFRYLLSNTVWNRTDLRPVMLPISSEQWQFEKGTAYITGLNLRARIRASQIEFMQTITSEMAGKLVYYEYLSKFWAQSSAGTNKETFTADDDVSLLDERLMTMGIIWRFKKAKGLDWETDLGEYNVELNRVMGYDGAARSLNMNGSGRLSRLGANVPDQGYG